MSMVRIILLALALPTAATAQTPAPASPAPPARAVAGWDSNWQVQLSPVFGSDRAVAPFPVGNEVIDESEFSVGANFARTFGNGVTLTLSPGASYSPNQFDADEPASALSLGTTFQGPLTREVQPPDALNWVVSHRVRADFDDAFGDYVRTDQAFGLGLEFTNVLNYLCGEGEVPYVGGGCTQSGGLEYKITPKLEWVESTDQDRERFNPKLAAAVSWPVGRYSALYVDASIERRFYESLDAPNGDPRRDMRVAATAGVDLSGWTRQAFHLPAAFSFKVGVRWVEVTSNDPAAEADQVYVVPELSWRQKF